MHIYMYMYMCIHKQTYTHTHLPGAVLGERLVPRTAGLQCRRGIDVAHMQQPQQHTACQILKSQYARTFANKVTVEDTFENSSLRP
jgi:hypothetical protein